MAPRVEIRPKTVWSVPSRFRHEPRPDGGVASRGPVCARALGLLSRRNRSRPSKSYSWATRKTANCNERCRRAPKGSSKGISPRTLLLLLAAEPIPAFSRSSAPADHSSPWPVAPNQTGRGAWMIPLTRTVGVSTDREPVSDASRMRRGSLQVHGAVASTTPRVKREEEDWSKCPALIRSCVMLGRKIGHPKEWAAKVSEFRQRLVPS